MVKFFTQTAESSEGQTLATIRPQLQQIVGYAERKEEEEFERSARDFIEQRVFKGGMSINLIKQILRGFDMIKEQPEFGTLILAKIDAITRDQEQQKAAVKESEPAFKPTDVKTAVSIAEDIDVDDDKPKTQGAAAMSPGASTSRMEEGKPSSSTADDPMTGIPTAGPSKVGAERKTSPVDPSTLLLRRPPQKERSKEEEKVEGGYRKLTPPMSFEGKGKGKQSESSLLSTIEKRKGKGSEYEFDPVSEEEIAAEKRKIGSMQDTSRIPQQGIYTPTGEEEKLATQKKLGTLKKEDSK